MAKPKRKAANVETQLTKEAHVEPQVMGRVAQRFLDMQAQRDFSVDQLSLAALDVGIEEILTNGNWGPGFYGKMKLIGQVHQMNHADGRKISVSGHVRTLHADTT